MAVSAAPAWAFRTPIYHMDCYTWTDKSGSGYYGAANCYGEGLWQVVVNCMWGFNPESEARSSRTEPGPPAADGAGAAPRSPRCCHGVP
jgi:hypothetical protein